MSIIPFILPININFLNINFFRSLPSSLKASISHNMTHHMPMPHALQAATCLMLLAISFTSATAVRILDEVQPPVVAAPLAVPPPEEAAVTNPTPASTAGIPAPDVKSGTIQAKPDPQHPLTFFMHDILGGSHASARVVTGIVSTTGVNGQLPFGKPNGGVFPINGGVPLPNGNLPFATGTNGAVITNNNFNNGPFLTGIGGLTATTGVINNNGNNIVSGGNRLPFVAGGQLPAGSTLQKLLFGTLTVIDDELTEGHEAGSSVVGRAQGFYVASSEDGTSQSMVFTAMFESGHYEDTISFFGVHRIVSDESQVAVIGGTGKYANAKGYATVKTLPPVDEHTTDGAESLLQLSVYLY